MKRTMLVMVVIAVICLMVGALAAGLIAPQRARTAAAQGIVATVGPEQGGQEQAPAGTLEENASPEGTGQQGGAAVAEPGQDGQEQEPGEQPDGPAATLNENEGAEGTEQQGETAAAEPEQAGQESDEQATAPASEPAANQGGTGAGQQGGAAISADQARAAALAANPGMSAVSTELDSEDGVPVYKVTLSDGRKVQVSAANGQVIQTSLSENGVEAGQTKEPAQSSGGQDGGSDQNRESDSGSGD